MIGATFTDDQKKRFGAVYAALVSVAMPAMLLPVILAQTAFETNYYKSNAFLIDNNASGIKWINKPYQDATIGIQSSEKGSHYAHFTNLTKWAIDLKRILSVNRGAGRPIDATTVQDYVHRLKANGYFGSSEAQYLAGIKRIMLAMQLLQDAAAEREGTALAAYQTPPTIIPASLQNIVEPFTKLSMPVKIALGVAAFLLLRKLL